MTFLCSIPGVDAATATWHGAVHLGLAGFVFVAGTGFLTSAFVAYRRSDPARVPRD